MKAILLITGVAFFWGITPLFEKLAYKSFDGEPNVLAMLWLRTVVALVALTLVLLFTGGFGDLKTLPLRGFAYIAIAGITVGLFAQLLLYAAFSTINLQTLMPLTSIYPLFTFVAVLLFMPSEADSLTPQKIIIKLVGILLIAAGVFLITYKTKDEVASGQAALILPQESHEKIADMPDGA